jgi:hypothetical protein
MGFETEHISYEQLLELVNKLSVEDKLRLKKEAFSDDLNALEIDAIMDNYHKRYEQTYKDLA